MLRQDRPRAGFCLTGKIHTGLVLEFYKPPASPARRKAETFTACRGTHTMKAH